MRHRSDLPATVHIDGIAYAAFLSDISQGGVALTDVEGRTDARVAFAERRGGAYATGATTAYQAAKVN